MAETHTGGCYCGAVEIEVHGEPLEMGYCHCENCRRYSAAPVSAFTLWKWENVKLTISKEDYLKAIAEAEAEEGNVIAATIARWLSVTPPAVALALRRLRRDKFVEVDRKGHITLTAAGQEVSDKLRFVALERGRAKDVIGVHVGHDHVLDRELSRLPNGGTQTLTVDQASARIDDRDGLVADDEADVGYAVFVLRCHVLIHATTDVNSRRDFFHDKHACDFRRGGCADLVCRKRGCLRRDLLREDGDAAKARAS